VAIRNRTPGRCVLCGRTFLAYASRRQRFCSIACGSRHSMRRRRDESKATFWARFWSRVVRSKDGCWLWHGPREQDGYGRVSLGAGRLARTHRLAWEATYGRIPKGRCVCHACDTRLCCRPDHLFLGTWQDNRRDTVIKQRHAVGSRVHNAKLTEAQVRAIRAGSTQYGAQRRWAWQLGVTETTVSYIVKRRTWRHVGG
jgi:HNH endonuclease